MRFKSYEQFLNENINEGILDSLKAIVKRVGNFFKGVGAQFLNMFVLRNDNKLPKGVTIYPTTVDIALLKSYGVEVTMPEIPKMDTEAPAKKTVVEHLKVNEVRIEQKYPDLGKVVDVDLNSLESYLRDCVEGGKDVKPLLVWGAPGIGKTAIINAIAKEYYGENAKQQRRMIDFDLMTMSPEDFFIPTVKDKNSEDPKAVRVPDEWLPVRRIDDEASEKNINGPDGKGGILFFDEIARCSTKVQNVCLKIIDERKIGNYILGSKWVIVCAANRKSDLSDDEQQAFHWSSTLANRFQQVNYAIKVEDWAPWASTAKNDLGKMIVMPEILAFIKFNAKYFHNLDPESFSNSSGGSEAWPSPRSWTNASQAIQAREARYERNKWKDKDGKSINPSKWNEEQQDILAANVGSEAAKNFMGFKRLMEKIRPEDVKLVYSKPDKAPKWKGLQVDEMYALIAAACFQMRGKEKLDKTEMKNFAKWLIDSKDAPNSIKAIKMLGEVVPALKDDDFWNGECKNDFVDAYPSIFSEEKQRN